MNRSMIAVVALALTMSAASAGEISLVQTWPDQYGKHPTWTVNCNGIKSFSETERSSFERNFNVAIEGMPLQAYAGNNIPDQIEACWAGRTHH